MKGRVYKAFEYVDQDGPDPDKKMWGVAEVFPDRHNMTVATGLSQVQAEEVAALLSGLESWTDGPDPSYWGSRPLVLYFPDAQTRDNFKRIIDIQFPHVRPVNLDK